MFYQITLQPDDAQEEQDKNENSNVDGSVFSLPKAVEFQNGLGTVEKSNTKNLPMYSAKN